MYKIVALVGPTGIGKDEYMYYINEKLNFPLLFVDSMKIYRTMNIATSKPSQEFLKKFTHFGIDIKNHWESFSAGEFFEYVNNIFCEFNHILAVAGSPLYLKVILTGIFKENIDTKNIREKLMQEVTSKGLPALYEELKSVDPAYATKISPNDQKRIIRALEVIRATGKPFSQFHIHFKQKPRYKTLTVGITADKEIIKKRIIERTRQMIKNGIIDEVSYLMKIADFSIQSREAIGYKETIKFLISGGQKIEELEKSIIKATLKYIKHQYSWFKKMVDVWVEGKEELKDTVFQFVGL